MLDVGLLSQLTVRAIKTLFLDAVDASLAPLGYRRRRRADQEWYLQRDDNHRLWVHVNFGNALVVPSLGVTYLDLATIVPLEAGAVVNAWAPLPTIIGQRLNFSLDDGPESPTNVLREVAPAVHAQLCDREWVIGRIDPDSPAEWPTMSYSDSIRLLPLLLASTGQGQSAHDYALRFLLESSGRDHIVPSFAHYASAFDAWSSRQGRSAGLPPQSQPN